MIDQPSVVAQKDRGRLSGLLTVQHGADGFEHVRAASPERKMKVTR